MSQIPPTFESIQRHPGTKLLRHIRAYELSTFVFRKNLCEMMDFLRKIEAEAEMRSASPSTEAAVLEMHSEAFRRLHNCVAATKTVVDHVRVSMQDGVLMNEHLVEYKSRVRESFECCKIVQFVHCFRNYVLHRSVPPLVYQVSYSAGITTRTYELSIKEIRSWEGWNAVAKSFVDSAPDRVRLALIMEQYECAIRAFSEWFVAAFERYYEDKIVEARELAAEFFQDTPGD